MLLLIDLLGTPWYRLTTGIPGLVFLTENRTGVEPPAGWLGVLALLVTLALLVVVGLQRLGRGELPEVAIPWPRLQFGAAVSAFVLVGLKFLSGVTLGRLFGLRADREPPTPREPVRVSAGDLVALAIVLFLAFEKSVPYVPLRHGLLAPLTLYLVADLAWASGGFSSWSRAPEIINSWWTGLARWATPSTRSTPWPPTRCP